MSALKKFILVATALAGISIASQARAQSCSATFSNISFGTVDVLPGTANDTGVGTLSASCTGITGSTKVLLCFGIGNGTYPQSGGWRQMGLGANRLLFHLYQDNARSTLWTSTGTGRVRVVLTRTSPSANVSVYGRVAGSQTTVPPGATYTTSMDTTAGGRTFSGGTTPSCNTVAMSPFANFSVSADVTSSCLVSATNLDFGSTSFFTSNIDATSTVSVTCTNTTPYHVRLDGGNAGATNPALRKMSLGANQITYGLYRDASRSLGWGSTDSVDTLDATGTASQVNHTVYGRIPPQASQPPGTYTDTVVVTVSFL